MLTMHIRATWKDRKPIIVGVAERSEVKKAISTNSVQDLIVQEDRMLFSLTNHVDVPDVEQGDYWKETAWHAMRYFSHDAFVEYCEDIVRCLIVIPKLPQVEALQGVLAYGDERWMPSKHGEDFTSELTVRPFDFSHAEVKDAGDSAEAE